MSGGVEASLLALEHCAFGSGSGEIPSGFLVLLDVARAFPTLDHMWIFSVLCASGAPLWLQDAVKALYSHQRNRFRVGRGLGPWHYVFRGIRQGDPMSALLFVFCMDPILRMTHAKRPPGNWLGAFADDVALILKHGDVIDIEWLALLEHLLWQEAALCISFEKTKILPLQAVGHAEFCLLLQEVLPHARGTSMVCGSRYWGSGWGLKVPSEHGKPL